MKLHKPANLPECSWDDILAHEAGQAYLLQQLDPYSVAIQLHQDKALTNISGAVCYMIYDDGSLWYNNPSSDEIWPAYTDFVQALIDTIGCTGLSWNEIDKMDRDILVYFCDGEVSEAQNLI